MEWSTEARLELEKIPASVRKMAKMGVEQAATEKGLDVVTVELMQETRAKYFGIMEKQENEEKTTKIAVVRCDIVSEVCPGVGCLNAYNKRKIKFAEYGDNVELIGFFTCGGCSGRRVSRLVDKLKDKFDLDVVHLSSCMLLDGNYPKCPFKNQIKQSIEAKGVKVVEGTHH